MATIYFTNTNDSGSGSFRQALIDSSAGDTIMPDASLTEYPIVLRPGTSYDSGFYTVTIKTGLAGKKIIFDGTDLASGRLTSTLASSSTASMELEDVCFRNFNYDAESSTVRGALFALYSGTCTFRRCGFVNVKQIGARGPIMFMSASGKSITAYFESCTSYNCGGVGSYALINFLTSQSESSIEFVGCTMGCPSSTFDVYFTSAAASLGSQTDSLIYNVGNAASLEYDFRNDVYGYNQGYYHLRNTSPLINQATVQRVDYNGTTIDVGNAVGAFYYEPVPEPSNSFYAFKATAVNYWDVTDYSGFDSEYIYVVTDYSISPERRWTDEI